MMRGGIIAVPLYNNTTPYSVIPAAAPESMHGMSFWIVLRKRVAHATTARAASGKTTLPLFYTEYVGQACNDEKRELCIYRYLMELL